MEPYVGLFEFYKKVLFWIVPKLDKHLSNGSERENHILFLEKIQVYNLNWPTARLSFGINSDKCSMWVCGLNGPLDFFKITHTLRWDTYQRSFTDEVGFIFSPLTLKLSFLFICWYLFLRIIIFVFPQFIDNLLLLIRWQKCVKSWLLFCLLFCLLIF